MQKVLAVILAGGQGERLSILSQERAKPAVPFAGKYRIIDFTLSNCVHSGINKVVVLTQYQPLSLVEHIGIGAPWGLVPPDRSIRILQAHLAPGKNRDWYRGTADAVYQNLDHIVEAEDIDSVLVLSGDHIYKMDYAPMLDFHIDNEADVTLAVTRFPEEKLQRFGTVVVDEKGQVVRFQEKVKQPQSNLVSMGVYLFKKDVLRQWLEERSGHDFGRNIFPKMAKKSRVFAYNFEGYWRDIGTVESYWQANMEMLDMSPAFISDYDWLIYTKEEEGPPTLIYGKAEVANSLLSSGCIIEGHVEHSILSSGVTVAEGAVVKDSIIMNDTVIGNDCVIDRTILDKEVTVGAGCHIGTGDDFQANRKNPQILNTGLTIIGRSAEIPPDTRIGRNCIIYSDILESDFSALEIQSGETIWSRLGRRGRKP
jgi:glucose-1-phosphate adenylyltransferase